MSPTQVVVIVIAVLILMALAAVAIVAGRRPGRSARAASTDRTDTESGETRASDAPDIRNAEATDVNGEGRTEYQDPAPLPTTFGATTVGDAVAASAMASGRPEDERDPRGEDTAVPGDGAPGRTDALDDERADPTAGNRLHDRDRWTGGVPARGAEPGRPRHAPPRPGYPGWITELRQEGSSMTDRDRYGQRPLEESPEVAAAVDDDSTVPQLRGARPDPDNPAFTEPDGAVPDTGSPDLLGDPYAAGTGATGTGTGAGGDNIRTGAEQPWEPEDLVTARGQDLTPENLERARRDLAELGRAAIEKTVP